MWLFDLFSSSKKIASAGEKLIDGAMSGLDKLILTEEEKRDFSVKAGELYLKHQGIIANENTARSITRRILATMIMAIFLLLLVFAVGTWKFYPEWAKFTLSVASNLSTGFTAIIIFYFGYYAVGNILDKKNGKG